MVTTWLRERRGGQERITDKQKAAEKKKLLFILNQNYTESNENESLFPSISILEQVESTLTFVNLEVTTITINS